MGIACGDQARPAVRRIEEVDLRSDDAGDRESVAG
jgi:hypothetical protein